MGSSSSISSRSLPNCERPTNEDEFENQMKNYEGQLEELNTEKMDKSLRFHEVCGRNIRFNSNKRIALRDEKSYCYGIVFSNRPLDIYERVYIRIIRLSSLWNGMIRFGFTSNDPNLMRKRANCKYSQNDENNNQNHQSSSINSSDIDYDVQNESNEDTYPYDLPKYVYPNLTNKKGYWASAMDENRIKENDIVYFYVNSNGEIHYGINDKYEGIFLSGVDVYNTRPKQAQPLWAMFDIYGSTLAIEIIDLQSSDESVVEMCKSTERRSRTRNNLTPVEHQASANSLEGMLESRLRMLQSSASNRANQNLNELDELSMEELEEKLRLLRCENASGAYRPVHTSSLGSTLSNGTSSSLNSNRSLTSSSSNNNHNHNHNNNNTRLVSNSSHNEHDSLDRLFISYRRLCIDNHYNETLHNSICDLPPSEPLNMLNERINAFYKSIPILIHDSMPCANTNRFVSRMHGRNVKISPDCLIAYRESSLNKFKDTYQHRNSITHHTTSTHEPTLNAYVFLDKPIEKGKYFCLQIVGIDQNVNESKMSLSIGCTTCKPHHLNPTRDLPDDADCLLDRAEYWIVYKNLFSRHQVSLADELCFRLDEHTGNLAFFINGILVTQCLFNVDITQTLWFFFDLCGKTNAIRLIPSCQFTSPNSSFMPQSHSTLKSIATSNNMNNAAVATTTTTSLNSMSNTSVSDNSTVRIKKKRPDSALIEYFKSQFLASQTNEEHAAHSDSLSNCKNQTSNQVMSDSCTTTTPTSTSTKTTRANKAESKVYNQEECRICWDAPIECVFYSCGHMCLCWKCALMLKNNPSKCVSFATMTTSTSDLHNNQTVTNSSTFMSDTMDHSRLENKTTKPLCPICRNEIIDIIRFFKT